MAVQELPRRVSTALSIVVPCFRKFAELGIVLPFNACYIGRPDVELVLVLDDPSEEREILALLDQLPLVRARVVVNDQPHEWRPPCIALNVGIRAALGEFILVVSPESVFAGDVVSRILSVLRERPADVLLGRVAWATFDEARGRRPEDLFTLAMEARGRDNYSQDYYGTVAASRALFHAVNGYDESLQLWGGDDDNIRARMSMHGALLMLDRQLSIVHLSQTEEFGRRREPSHSYVQGRVLVNPAAAKANPEQWGAQFGRVARDWNAPSAASTAKARRITTGVTPRGAAGRPDVMAVFSFRYDAHLVGDLLENIGPMVDGWVAYDDRDSDALFSDERERRRLLVQTAHELGARWILAVDPDERFEQGLAGRIEEMTGTLNPVCWMFNLREMYAADRYRIDGLWGRKSQRRLFPLRGDLRFGAQALHSPWCTYPSLDSGLNLYHLKMIAPERREGRKALYNHLDPERRFQSAGYDYLADEEGAELETIPQGREYFPRHRDDGGLWMPAPPG